VADVDLRRLVDLARDHAWPFPVGRSPRRTEWFIVRVAELPRRTPHVSSSLVEATAIDQGADE